MFGLTRREQRWKAEQKAAEALISLISATVRAAAEIRVAEANTEAAELERLRAEVARLTAALKRANDQAEHFEREWYLRGDQIEAALPAMREYARKNPKHHFSKDGAEQDPNGAHAWLERNELFNPPAKRRRSRPLERPVRRYVDPKRERQPMTVAVLFARADSHYKALPGCDVWDAERDARKWPGGAPVVAHPPCRAWASLRFHAKPRDGEKQLAIDAVAHVRRFGGVLEHPHRSTLWPTAALPEPGERDEFGGWTLVVDQQWWGHRAQKRTRLYIVGCEPTAIPAMPIVLGEATHTVGLWSGRDKQRCRPSIAKREYEATPPEFAAWLVELARRCAK